MNRIKNTSAWILRHAFAVGLAALAVSLASPTPGQSQETGADDRYAALLLEIEAIGIEDARDPVDVAAVGGRRSLGVRVADAALGPRVTAVDAGGAADRAGVVVGDHLSEIDGAEVDSPQALEDAVAGHPPDEPLQLTYLRNNRRYTREIVFQSPDVAPGAADGTPALAAGETSRRSVARLEEEIRSLRRDIAVLQRAVRLLILEHADVEGESQQPQQ